MSPPYLIGDLCSSLAGRAVVFMSPPPSLIGDLCSSPVGSVVVCSFPSPDRRLVFQSCRQGGCVCDPFPPYLTGNVCSSLVCVYCMMFAKCHANIFRLRFFHFVLVCVYCMPHLMFAMCYVSCGKF